MHPLPPLEGLKIVTAQEMARIEQLAREEGASELQFMENAADSLALLVTAFLEEYNLPKTLTLLVGKGNNAGDTYAVGARLLQKKYSVDAWQIYPLESSSPLCKQMHEQFLSQGGTVHFITEEKDFHFEPQGVILDGLVGTGFKGRAEGILALAIAAANASEHPILAIDIPSGVNGTTGEVGTIAIQAKETLFLEFPKTGFFLGEGFNHIGTLRYAHFALPEKFRHDAKATAALFNIEAAPRFLPPLKRNQHKYQAGYVLGFAGSVEMPGAALLSCSAALRSGAGIVRLFHPPEMQSALSAAPYELIHEAWDGRTSQRLEEEAARAKAVLIGPGMGRNPEAEKRVEKLLSLFTLPTVIDADALFHLANHLEWSLPEHTILTPHHKEMERLLHSPNDESLLAKSQKFAEEKKVTIILKGAPTFILHPRTIPLCIPRGDPGMATAGSGDVLTGMVAALLAHGLDPRTAASLAVYLHALAGERAACALSSYSVTASDLLDFISEAFSSLN